MKCFLFLKQLKRPCHHEVRDLIVVTPINQECYFCQQSEKSLNIVLALTQGDLYHHRIIISIIIALI